MDACLVNLCVSRGLRVRDLTVSCKTCVYASVCVKSGSYSPPKADSFASSAPF